MGWRDFVISTYVEKVEKVEKEGVMGSHIPLIPLIPPERISENDDPEDETPGESLLESRRQMVLELLTANPGKRYALVTDAETEPEFVILALAIRGQATCELRVLRDKYDGFLLLDLLNRYGGSVH